MFRFEHLQNYCNNKYYVYDSFEVKVMQQLIFQFSTFFEVAI